MNNNIKQLEIIDSICGFVGGDEIKSLITTKDTTTLTRKLISHLRTQLSFILEESLLQRELIGNKARTTQQQKSMPYLLRAICRTILHTLRIEQTKKDLELLLFNQLETVISETDPPFFPSTWKTQTGTSTSPTTKPYSLLSEITKKYLHIPIQRPGVSDEFVLLTEADQFSSGENIYILAESIKGKPWKQYCYYPTKDFISHTYDTLQTAEIRKKDLCYPGFVTEKYQYHLPSSNALTRLSDMMMTANSNQKVSPHEFGVDILTWYLVLRVTELHTPASTEHIPLDEQFYFNALQLINNKSQEHESLIKGFIDTYGLPKDMINFTTYCAERLSAHPWAWTGTKEHVNKFTSDTSTHKVRSSKEHASLIKSIKNLLRIFCKQHYITNEIVVSIQQIP